MIFFLKIHLLIESWSCRETGSEREGKREIDLPSAISFPRWSQWPVMGASSGSPKGMTGTQELGISSAAFPRPLAGSWIGIRTPKTQNSANTECWWCRWQIHALHHNAGPFMMVLRENLCISGFWWLVATPSVLGLVNASLHLHLYCHPSVFSPCVSPFLLRRPSYRMEAHLLHSGLILADLIHNDPVSK